MAEEQGNAAIPLVEERVVTSKRLVETGRVRVQTVVDEREDMVREQLGRVEVDVERVPVNQEVDEVPPVREDGDVTIIPVVEEVLVVTKKLVVTEEIRIRRRKTMEEHSEPVMLRSQRVVVEREDGEGDAVSRL
jgi:stress response protein YsnF